MNVSDKAELLKKTAGNLRVLYVEDDSMLRAETSNFFRQIYKKIDLATDGKEGMELYKQYFLDNNSYYDIVITDIQMPNLNGIDMCKEILEINKEQKIIVISAHEEKEYLLEAINIGIDGFIQKPLNIDKAIEVLYKTCITFQSDDLQYFRALTEASIVSKTDINGSITYVNDNFCKITGYKHDEMIGANHNMFRHPSSSNILYEEMWNTITLGKIWRSSMTNLNKDGSDFIFEITIIPLVDVRGNIKEYIAIRNDITDMEIFKRNMAKKENERQKHNKVKDAQKSFLIVFTHELKTPLNAIVNFSKYIKKQLQQPKDLNREKIIKLLDSVLINAQDMLANITQILETSKLTAGKLNYNYKLFNPSCVISEILKKFNSLISEKNIKIIIDFNQDVFIYSDEHRVGQIVSNILSNAIKYGNGEIEIKTFSAAGKAAISIEDNGLGIKDKEAVFELYAQEDENILQRKGQGTGIGLYYVKLLCKDLKIKYILEDGKNGIGTKFTLLFDSKININKGV